MTTDELTVYKTQLSGVVGAAESLTITSEADVAAGADILHNLKQIENAVLERKEEITRPLMASLASTRELFKPFETAFDAAKKTIKKKILDYQVAEQNRIDEERARIAARVEKGTMRADTAVKKMESVTDVKNSTSGSVGKVAMRTLTKVRITDETLIPRMYLVPDMGKITTAVLQGGIDVPGVEKYTEKVLASR